MANMRKSDYQNDFPHGSSEVKGAKNLGEVASRQVPNIGKTDFGNYKDQHARARVISTSVKLGERGMDNFHKKRTMQDFLDDTAKNYGKKGMTYGG